jgi:multicomponent Na+:H+ antiporter subunit B
VTTVIARTAVRFVVPIALVTALALLVQGHNLPGGGFIAGVLTAAAVSLVYVVFGLEELTTMLGTRSRGPFGHAPVAYYRVVLGLGLALAAGSGLVPLLFGLPFLTQDFWVLHGVPLFGEVELASAVAFDLGVYLTVVGALLSIVAVVGTE